MGAEEVVEKILADAGAEAGRIKSEAEDKQAAEQAKLAERLGEYRKQTEILAQKAGKDKKLHLLAAARMDIAKQYLAEKRKLLDEIFARVRRRLQDLPDDEYRKLMTKLILDAVETGDEEVIVDNNETRIDRQLINQVNERLSSDSKGNLKLADEKQNLGVGFVLRHGRIKNNVSLDVILAQARKELEIELARELFS